MEKQEYHKCDYATWIQNRSFGFDYALKLFFSVLNLSIISLGDAFGPDFVAALYEDGDTDKYFRYARGSATIQDDHVPHWLARQAPKYVPLLLVADRSAADSDRMGSDHLPEPRKRWIPRVDGEGEAEITCGVLVPDVGNSGVWERGETFECVVHLCACTFEEDATACDEERVAREDRTGGQGRRCVGHVVADRVLGVARRCETPGSRGWVSGGPGE